MIISHFILTNAVVGDATIALAVATFLLAAVTAYGVVLTRRALKVANRDTEEAIKSRIDQRAQRITIVAMAPGSATKSWDSSTPPITEMGGVDIIDEDEQEIGLTGWFKLSNEGYSTAIVELPAGVLSFAKDHPISSLNTIQAQRPSDVRQFPILPGDGAVLFVHATRTFAEWRSIYEQETSHREPLVVKIVAEDTFSEGVSDTTELHLRGVPISKSENAWTGKPEVATRLAVKRTTRGYHNLPVRR